MKDMRNPTGDDVVLAHAEAMHARDLTCKSLGIALEEVEPGRAVLSMQIAEDMVNGHGIGHGGYVFLLADAAFAYACNSHGPVAVAQTAQVTFLQPVRPGDRLAAEAGMAFADLIRAGELDRLRVCAGDDCDAVLVDLTRNRSRIYCDTGNCGNRQHVAAYRARQRGES